MYLFGRSKTRSVNIFILEEELKKEKLEKKYSYNTGSVRHSTEGLLSFSEDSTSKITQFFLHISSASFSIMNSMKRIFQLQLHHHLVRFYISLFF